MPAFIKLRMHSHYSFQRDGDPVHLDAAKVVAVYPANSWRRGSVVRVAGDRDPYLVVETPSVVLRRLKAALAG